MHEFRIEFLIQREQLGLKKKEIAEALGITAPTLQSKLRNPDKLTIDNFNILTGLGFNFDNLIKEKWNNNQKRKLKQKLVE